ncbi:MAG: GYF domain-containing protein [Polyangiaceae bacterium]
MYWAREHGARWYVSQHGKTVGPYPEERLKVLLQWGKVSREAYICDEQCSSWIAIKRSAFAPLLERQEAASEGEAGADALTGASQASSGLFAREHWAVWALSLVVASALGTVILL